MTSLGNLFFQQTSSLISQARSTGYLKPEQCLLHNQDLQADRFQSAVSSVFSHSRLRVKGLRLLLVFLKVLKWRWLMVLAGKLLITSCIVLAPILTNQMLHALRQNLGPRVVFQSLALLLLQKGAKSLLATHIDFQQYRMGCIFYGQLASVLYDRQLSSKGRTLNLLEEDGYRLINMPYFLVELLMVPLQIVYGVYMLCWAVGLRILNTHVYIFVTYLFMCVVLVLVDLKLNKRLMNRKDCRAEALLDYLNDQSQSNTKRCSKARADELKTQRALFAVDVSTRSFSSIICSLMLVVALITFSEQLTQAQVFSLILLFNELRYPCNQFPSLLSNFIQQYVSLRRLEEMCIPQPDQPHTHPLEARLLVSEANINSSFSQEVINIASNTQFHELRNPNNTISVNTAAVDQLYQIVPHKNSLFHGIFLFEPQNEPKLQHLLRALGIKQSTIVTELKNTALLTAILRQLYLKDILLLTQQLHRQFQQELGQQRVAQLLRSIHVDNQYRIYVSADLKDLTIAQDADDQSSLEATATIQYQVDAQTSNQQEHHERGSIGLSTYSSYLQLSTRGYLIIPFTICCLIAQAMAVYSTLVYRNHTQHPTISFTFDSLLFTVPFLSIIPTACALVCILSISLKSSRNLFDTITGTIHQLLKRFEKRVVANRLSNDLKFFDKNFCLCLYDIVATGCAICGSLGLCLMGLGEKDYLWMLGTLLILIVLASSMFVLNRRSMWALRECLRSEGGLRTLSISALYDCSHFMPMLRYYGQESQAKAQYLRLVSRIVNTHLSVISIECWFGIRLLFLSLAGCVVMCGASLLLELDPAVVGVTMSFTLALDDLFQTFFLNAISLQKAGVAVQRCLALLKPL